ncbi:MAG: hypothetical protein ACJ740_12110 [Gaiellales bacterium]|jgi:hypothetical protein|nr:hypothetical protein [Gaiellales bacterium]
MAFKALILRVVADEERSRPKSTPPAHPWGTVRSRRSRDVEQRLTAANSSHRR